MTLIALRGEEPPDDTVVVIRGGEKGLTAETLRRTATATHREFGFYGVSVFLALDFGSPSCALRRTSCAATRRSRSRRAGRVRAAGFALLATEARPHFDIVLPDLDDHTLDRLRACFGDPRPNPGRS